MQTILYRMNNQEDELMVPFWYTLTKNSATLNEYIVDTRIAMEFALKVEDTQMYYLRHLIHKVWQSFVRKLGRSNSHSYFFFCYIVFLEGTQMKIKGIRFYTCSTTSALYFPINDWRTGLYQMLVPGKKLRNKFARWPPCEPCDLNND